MTNMYDLLAKMKLLEGKGAKPDFLDLDKDGNKKEPMKKASQEVDEASYSAKDARAGKDIGKPGKNFEKIAKDAGERYGSKEKGEKVAGAVLNKLRHPKEDIEEGIMDTVKKVGGKVLDKLGHGSDEDLIADLQKKAGVPVTGQKPQQPKEGVDKAAFAALAPPKDKITFADKIAGAKKEVDEVLGDVAASAIKKAVGKAAQPVVDEAGLDMNLLKKMQGGMKSTNTDSESERNKHKKYGYRSDRDDSGSDDDYDEWGNEKKKKKKVGAVADGPKKRGRPAGTKRSIGAKGPSGKSKLLSKGAIKEADSEGSDLVKLAKVIASCKTRDQLLTAQQMANNFLKKYQQSGISNIGSNMRRLSDVDDTLQQKNRELKGEVDEKAPPGAKAERMVKGIKKSLSKDGHLSDKDKAIAYATTWKAHKQGKVEEEDTEERDTKAEKAGKKVTKDIEYDEKKKDGIHGKKRGSEDDKAEKAGKKVAKDIEYDEKKDSKKDSKKEEKVDETTVAGSVAVAPGGASKSKGGMQFGKGVYEGAIAESFNKKLSTVLTEGLSINASQDESGAKTLTVNATDEDALKLAQILQLAGMPQGSGYEEACPHCGQAPCGCEHEEGMAEGEYANSPEVEVSDTDTMVNTLSGGLNGRKSTGQTTIPVVNRDPARGSIGPVAEEIKEQAETKLWNLYKKYGQ